MGSFGPMRVLVSVTAPRRRTRRSISFPTSTPCWTRPTWCSWTRPGRASGGSSERANPATSTGRRDMRAFGQFVSRYISTYGRWGFAQISLRRIVRHAAVGGAVELSARPGHRHQRRGAALRRFWTSASTGTRIFRDGDRRRAIGRTRSTCRRRRPLRGITTGCPEDSTRPRSTSFCRRSSSSR